MTQVNDIINGLEHNLDIFNAHVKDLSKEFYEWRPSKDKWCLLEILCHLYDEERLDFRFRVKWVLERPNEVPPAINPLNWVTEHDYMSQDYTHMVKKFNSERKASIDWLRALKSPNWQQAFEHPKLGLLSADYFLHNWLAHDYLHFRQITKQKFDYLKFKSGVDLNYAGTW